MKSVVWRRAAESDAADAAFWHVQQGGLVLGERFLVALHAALDDIAQQPASGSARHAAIVPDLPAKLRFRRLNPFNRYLVYYIDLPDHIEIIRIWHASRGLHALMEDPGEST